MFDEVEGGGIQVWWFSILGCPTFACFWQTWDLAQRTSPSLWFLEFVVMDGPHFSQKRREMGHPKIATFICVGLKQPYPRIPPTVSPVQSKMARQCQPTPPLPFPDRLHHRAQSPRSADTFCWKTTSTSS
jgi:hypothetical protein